VEVEIRSLHWYSTISPVTRLVPLAFILRSIVQAVKRELERDAARMSPDRSLEAKCTLVINDSAGDNGHTFVWASAQKRNDNTGSSGV
jgi:hypothetical protein